MADDSPAAESVASLRLAREEARTTLDTQLAALDDIDRKAHAVFRLDIALVGVLLSALSAVAALDGVAVSALTNAGTAVGVAAFVGSAVAAGVTYVTGGHHIGASPAGLRRAEDLSEAAYLAWLVDGYADWIRANERANERKALLVTIAILAAVGGTIALGVGVAIAVTDRVLGPTVVAILAVAAVAWVVDLPTQLRRQFGATDRGRGTVAAQDLEAPMTAQRALRGRDRR